MAGGGKGSSKGGSSGHASNAALQDDEDIMARRKVLFGKWKASRKDKRPTHPNHMIDYAQSPEPPKKMR